MKKKYFLLLLFCLFVKNFIEYKYDGPAANSFWQKWTTVLNASSQILDNDIESSLVNFRQGSNTNLEVDYNHPTKHTTQNIPDFISSNQDNYSYHESISYHNQQPQISNYQVQYICNNNNISYSNNVLASNGIYIGKGPSDIGITNDMATAEPFSSSTWGNTDVGINGGPGGPGSGSGDDPFGGGIPVDTPIDGGLSLLMAVAVGKGIKSLQKTRKNKNMII